MAYSSWKIWLHPRVTRRVMEDLEAQGACKEILEAELAARSRATAEDKQRLETLEESNRALEAENVTLKNSVETLAEQIVQLRRELDDRKSTEDQLKQFDDILDRTRSMKEGYERRIALLRAKVKELKKENGFGEPEADELKIIDMEEERGEDSGESLPEKVAPGPSAAPARSTTEEEDWVKPLPF